jgi:hypothetical protein
MKRLVNEKERIDAMQRRISLRKRRQTGQRFICHVGDKLYERTREEGRQACKKLDFYAEFDGERYCVLHFPSTEKGDNFRRAIDRKLKNEDFNFAGVYFPGDQSFESCEFRSEANFTQACFTGNANFEGATFHKKANFFEVTFDGQASFFGTTFNGQRFSGGQDSTGTHIFPKPSS